ncbi:MAG: polysaccharide deacetylase family protein [Actinomycetota bacterium]|nr:polysaccharide deacetylase family protein [Actinomycetota bacterium]
MIHKKSVFKFAIAVFPIVLLVIALLFLINRSTNNGHIPAKIAKKQSVVKQVSPSEDTQASESTRTGKEDNSSEVTATIESTNTVENTITALGLATKQPIPVFLYHHISPNPSNYIAVSPATFEEHLKALSARGYHSISLNQLYSHLVKGALLPPKPVLITFDDGLKSQYIYAVPLLKKYKFTATFFIYAEAINSKYGEYMSTSDIISLSKQGFDIGSHTWTHPSLVKRKDETIEDYNKRMNFELVKSKQWLEQKIGKEVIAIAYPYGKCDALTAQAVYASGYRLGFTIEGAVNYREGQPNLLLKRFVIENGLPWDGFVKKLQCNIPDIKQANPRPSSIVKEKPIVFSAVFGDTTNLNVKTLKLFIDHRLIGTKFGPYKGQKILYAPERYVLGPGLHFASIKGFDRAGHPISNSWLFYVKND